MLHFKGTIRLRPRIKRIIECVSFVKVPSKSWCVALDRWLGGTSGPLNNPTEKRGEGAMPLKFSLLLPHELLDELKLENNERAETSSQMLITATNTN